jgi:hypothetical protein
VVPVQELQKLVDLRFAEPAEVVAVVNVAGRGSDQHEAAEQLRRPFSGQDADHGADRVADEDTVGHAELAAQRDHVVGVAVERAVTARVVGGEV